MTNKLAFIGVIPNGILTGVVIASFGNVMEEEDCVARFNATDVKFTSLIVSLPGTDVIIVPDIVYVLFL